jgi:hypothetical protein
MSATVATKRQSAAAATPTDADDADALPTKRACMAHLVPIDAEAAITVHPYLLDSDDGAIAMPAMTLCRATACWRCQRVLLDGERITVSGGPDHSCTNVHLQHFDCGAYKAGRRLIAKHLLVQEGAELEHCAALGLVAGAVGLVFAERGRKCSRCDVPLKENDQIYLDDETPAASRGVLHVACGTRCSVQSCSYTPLERGGALCRAHAQSCAACSAPIGTPGRNAWASKHVTPQNKRAPMKHQACATADESGSAARFIQCGALDCRDRHAFLAGVVTNYSGQHARGATAAPETVLLCCEVKCICCKERPLADDFLQALQTGTQFLDGVPVCRDCLQKRCSCAGGIEIAASLTSLAEAYHCIKVCPRHIGPGWRFLSRKAVGRCHECNDWVNVVGENADGFIEHYEGPGGTDVTDAVHFTCYEAAKRSAEQ